eukprot:m.64278 g.64278  ORF g.64278 m.64278 type:complete len:464 (+) comp23408_c0_seq1:1-1392(+)
MALFAITVSAAYALVAAAISTPTIVTENEQHQFQRYLHNPNQAASMGSMTNVGDSSTASDPPPNLAQSVLLSDYVESHGARCLDGSPPRFWIQPSTSTSMENRSKWYFHFMGGGWCESMESCTSRAYDPKNCYRGSSNLSCFNNNGDREPGFDFNETMDFRNVPCINGARWGGGLLMGTADTNPLTYDWNKVEVVYCDGGSYAGNNQTVSMVSYNNQTLPLYFRGQANLEATMDYLSTHHNVDAATHFLISGDSAGGLASYWHADWFKQRLPDTKVVVAPDSGFFLGDVTKPSWPASLAWIATQMNATAGLDQSCVEAAIKAGKVVATSCTLPEDVSKFIETPLFAMNSRYDPALIGICTNHEDINQIGQKVINAINASVLQGRPGNAAFITSCNEHCGQWAQGQVLAGHNDFNVTIDGWTAPYALNAWVSRMWGHTTTATSRTLWLQEATYPCHTCCSGGQQ